MSASLTRRARSVAGAPNLPAGFTDTFTSHYLDTGRLRQHAVIGGQGPPLLVHGWPEKRLLAALTRFLAPYRVGVPA